jgi:hypothetical protein
MIVRMNDNYYLYPVPIARNDVYTVIITSPKLSRPVLIRAQGMYMPSKGYGAIILPKNLDYIWRALENEEVDVSIGLGY